MNQKATLIAALAVCSSAAFIAGRVSSKPQAELSESTDPAFGTRAEALRNARNGAPAGPRAAGQSSARDRSPGTTGLSRSADPIQQMEAIMNDPDPLARTEAWLRFVKGLDPSEIEDVVAKFRAKDLARFNLTEYSMLLTAWANHDPLSALDYAKENTSTPFARQTILASWAAADPAGAIQWAEANHEGEGANPWMVGVIRGIASSDPDRATELTNAMPFSRERGEALSAVQGHYLKQGPEAARAWALSIEDERLRDGAISRIAENLARTDPKGTADWLIANPSEGSTRAMDEVMERMAENDPAAAVAYFQTITDETMRANAFEGIIDQIARNDPQAAITLIDSNPSVANDDVFEEFVWSARGEDPALAAATISRIQNTENQSRTYRRYLGRWLRTDFDAATDWVSQNDLPEGVVRSVDTMIQRMQNAEQQPGR